MKKFYLQVVFWVTIFSAVCYSNDDPKVIYKIGWDKPNSHLFHVEINLHGLKSDTTLLRIPGWRPGRYVMQNFPKNIILFEARDATGAPLPGRKIDKLTWQIIHAETRDITVRYQYYARQLDGGASYLDASEAYINPQTLLMYLPGQELLPVQLKIDKPEDWQIAVALDFDAEQQAYVSENYHELIDAPIIISPDFKTLSFDEKGATFDLVFQGEANYDSLKLIQDMQKIAHEQIEVMRHVPFQRYIFLVHLLPVRFGHGVEHKNSTSIVTGPADFDNKGFYRRFLGVSSHELFHAWNVERIRPEAIYLPDYSTEQYTTTMWIYEGFTSYYGRLAMQRAGVMDKKKYLSEIGSLFKGIDNSYGAKISSVALSSWDSWAKGYGSAPPNTSVSFYSKGEALGFLLDLDIRNQTGGKKSLDDVMRYLYEEYAMQERGVPEDGMQRALRKISGKDYAGFFDKYVFGTDEIDYGSYLIHAGLELHLEADAKQPEVYSGIQTRSDGEFLRVRNVVPESPGFVAGLDIDDRLVALDRRRIRTDNMTTLLKSYSAGDTVTVSVFRKNVLRDFELVFAGGGNIKYVLKEIEEPSTLQREILKSWLKEKE